MCQVHWPLWGAEQFTCSHAGPETLISPAPPLSILCMINLLKNVANLMVGLDLHFSNSYWGLAFSNMFIGTLRMFSSPLAPFPFGFLSFPNWFVRSLYAGFSPLAIKCIKY